LRSKRITVRLSEGQMEILRELMRALRTGNVSDAVRFCVELTGLVLSISSEYYTLGIVGAIGEAVRRVKASDAMSDKGIKHPAENKHSGG